MSIHAMPKISEGFANLLGMLGFAIIRNNTDVDFITSDNPVIWFDASVSYENMRPHTIAPNNPILFFFPVSRDLAILGSIEAKPYFLEFGLYEGQCATEGFVHKMNRLVARFAYQAFYASTSNHRGLVSEFADISPTVEFNHVPTPNGIVTFYNRVFGKRKKPTKWNGRNQA
ncbi:DUF4238 domain-containing protein [Actibacterium sp. D379-3]